MVYAYDNWVQLPTRDLYDTQMMSIAINAAKDMYEKGQQEIKDFSKEYGDFITPILADQDWYNQNVTGRVRDTINKLYSAGIDPTRSAEGRAYLSRLINSIDVGSVAKLRSSAENAKEYLKERAKLEASGLYNPLLEKYAGKGLDTFSTLGGDGVWNRMSPTPYQNMADFTKAYFDNISPIQRQATKNGISYTVSEVTEDMLKDIADRHFNDLVNTAQGQLMFKMYKDIYGTDEAARKAFNQAVVSGNLDRKKYADNFNEMELQQQKLNLERQKIAISRERLNLAKDAAKKKEEEAANGWTRRQSVNIMQNGRKPLDLPSNLGNKGLTDNDRKLLSQNYSAYQTRLVPGSHDMNTARALFSGLTTPVSIAEQEVVKRRPVTFSSNGGLNFTAQRHFTYAGRNMTNGSISNRLRNYMAKHNVTGYVVHDDDMSVNMMYYADDARLWDINGYVRVKADDLKGFDGDLQNALKNIGAIKGTRKLQIGTSRGMKKYKDEDYYDIPVSRTIDSRGYSDSEIDMLGDALNLTKSTAAKRQADYEEESIYDD